MGHRNVGSQTVTLHKRLKSEKRQTMSDLSFFCVGNLFVDCLLGNI